MALWVVTIDGGAALPIPNNGSNGLNKNKNKGNISSLVWLFNLAHKIDAFVEIVDFQLFDHEMLVRIWIRSLI